MQVELELILVSAGTCVHAFDQLTGAMFSKCNVMMCQYVVPYSNNCVIMSLHTCHCVSVYLHHM